MLFSAFLLTVFLLHAVAKSSHLPATSQIFPMGINQKTRIIKTKPVVFIHISFIRMDRKHTVEGLLRDIIAIDGVFQVEEL